MAYSKTAVTPVCEQWSAIVLHKAIKITLMWLFCGIVASCRNLMISFLCGCHCYVKCEKDIIVGITTGIFVMQLLWTRGFFVLGNSNCSCLVLYLLCTCQQGYKVSYQIVWPEIAGLVQSCSISIANTLEILQFCIKPWKCYHLTWWHHDLKMLVASLVYEGNPSVISGFLTQRATSMGFWFFVVSLNKLLYKQSSFWWFELMWCHC